MNAPEVYGMGDSPLHTLRYTMIAITAGGPPGAKLVPSVSATHMVFMELRVDPSVGGPLDAFAFDGATDGSALVVTDETGAVVGLSVEVRVDGEIDDAWMLALVKRPGA